jgi:hypothetical protein
VSRIPAKETERNRDRPGEDGKYISDSDGKAESKREDPTAEITSVIPTECLPTRRALRGARSRQMKFVLVNDRMPGKQSSCLMCGKPLGTGYLREIGTRLFYCDHDCYADHCDSAAQALEISPQPPLGFFTPSQMKARSDAER